jgi:ketosteroid isomerase-like protein
MDQIHEQSLESGVQQILDAWAAAEQRGDTSFLDGFVADDFIGFGPRGFLLTKADWLRRFTSGDLELDSFTLDEVKVRVYGETAVVIGREAQKGTFQRHNIQGLSSRATLVLVRQEESWRLVSLHLCPLAQAS